MQPTYLQNLCNQISSCALIIDRSLEIKACNKKVADATGFLEVQLIGKRYNELFNSGDRNQLKLAQKEKFSLQKTVIQTSSGSSLTIQLLVIPLADDSKLLNYLIIFVPVIEEDNKNNHFEKYGLIGSSGLINEVCYQIQNVAPTNAPVLIQGDTGTGKEVVARIIHSLSSRNHEKMYTVNCAAITESLLESELFGHVKGSFTGADRDRKGLFESADGGTVFLDEIGEITHSFQAKLLRVLQSGEFQRVGSSEVINTDVRLISATNKNLRQLSKEGTFREDLYYRLCVFPVTMPPLRERRSDIPLLIDYFIKLFNQQYCQQKVGMQEVALTMLFKYKFPGNIRELRNIIEHAYIINKDVLISPWDLPRYVQEEVDLNLFNNKRSDHTDDDIRQILASFNGNKAKTAKHLGISRKTLYNRLKKFN